MSSMVEIFEAQKAKEAKQKEDEERIKAQQEAEAKRRREEAREELLDNLPSQIQSINTSISELNRTLNYLSTNKDKDFINFVERTNTRYADLSKSINELQSNIDNLKSHNSTSSIASNVDSIDGHVRMMHDSILTIRNHIEAVKVAFFSVVALFAVTLITTIFYNHSLSNDIEFVNRRTQRIMITQSLQVPDEETIWAPYLEEDELIEKIRGYHGALLKQQKTSKQTQQ